jgi:PIN domain nuclease of toxin-antitoxin system
VNESFVLDASALLCLLHDEKGAARVAEALPRSIVSAVNLSEAVAKLADAGLPADHISVAVESLQLAIVPFDKDQAEFAGLLRPKTRHAGLSVGDRACLALGLMRKAIVLTCDRAWSKLDLGVAVEQLR